MEPSHKGKERAKVNTKCLEEVKTKGSKPIVFDLMIKINKDKKINNEPGIISPPKTAPNSSRRPFKINRNLDKN